MDLLETKDTLIEKQNSDIEALRKQIEELQKEKNQNPVDKGTEVESKPATSGEDVGDKADAQNHVAPKPSEAQASIIPPAVKPPGDDNSGLSMENKSDDDEKPKEKEEEMKKEEKTEEKEEKEEMKKSEPDSIYKVVETVRPLIKAREVDYTKVPTAYQMLKAVEQGFGQTRDAEQSLILMHQKMQNGEFGTGNPSGGVY